MIGTAEKGDLECIAMKIITVCIGHSLSSRSAVGFGPHAGMLRWDLPPEQPEDIGGLQNPKNFRAQWC